MTKTFRFRHVSEVVGGFVLLVLIALVVAVILIGHAQAWFEPTYSLRVKFPPEGSWGVQKGAQVVILGTPVGAVKEMLVNDDGSMEGILHIRGRFIRFIRSDSDAILKKQFGVAGDAFIEITKGSAAPIRSGGILPAPAKKDTELIELMEELLEQIRSATLPVLEQFRKAAEEYTGLASDFRKPTGHFQQLLGRFEALADGLEKGQGTAGKLLKDPATINGVNEAVAQVNTLLRQVETILADVKKASDDLPAMMLQTQDTVRDAEVLMQGIQKHWLLRSYMQPLAPSERIPPSEVTLPGGPQP